MSEQMRKPSDDTIYDGAALDFTVKNRSSLVIVTPDVARIWIDKFNIHNRRVRVLLVKYLADQIKNGEWQADHIQPIAFSDKMRLIDGQHRLFAIIQAGRTVVCNLCTWCRDELRKYIDTGISRQLEDRVEFNEDIEVNRRCAQIINCLGYIELNKPVRLSAGVAIDTFIKNEQSILYCARLMSRVRQRGVTRTATMSALAQMHSRNSAKAEEFGDQLIKAAPQSRTVAYLRDWLLTCASTGGSQNVADAYGRSVSAMKAYLEDRELNQTPRVGKW